MTDPKDPERPSGEDEIYVIDDTGDLEEVQQLAGYRETPLPVGEEEEPPSPRAVSPPDEAADPGELERLRSENQKLRDQFLRARADLENYRKRAEREKTDYFRYALAETVREILPVLDNFDRALAADSGVSDEFRTGIEMIQKQLWDTLGRAGLSAVDPAGQPFDPSYHEAIAREETAEMEPNHVTEVLQKGYLLHDRLLRPALVKVSAAPAKIEGTGDANPS